MKKYLYIFKSELMSNLQYIGNTLVGFASSITNENRPIKIISSELITTASVPEISIMITCSRFNTGILFKNNTPKISPSGMYKTAVIAELPR